jgi:uncharacterized protein
MLEFYSGNGNMYAWDNEVGLSIPFSHTMRAVMNELSDQKSISNKGIIIKKLKKDFEEEEISYCYDWIKKWEKIKFQNYRLQIPYTVSISDIRQFVLRNCLLQLTLNVTEDCNFRCKYCVYSNNYKYTRHHSDRYMYFSIAKKSIDHFFSLTKEGLRYNPLRVPAVGFYGGEPLLNFDLIKECVEYIEDKYKMYHTHYVLTTNGSLLDEEKANWLMQYDFSISISLDGPEDEHDRLRVYRSGHGTFQDIMSNIKPIMDAKYKKIHSQTVFDWKSDLFKIDEFFNRSDVPHITGASIVNNVGGCKYYNRFSEEDNTAFMKRLEEAKIFYLENHDYYKSHAGASFFDLLFGKGAAQVLFGPGSLLHPFSIMPFTGTCVPGRKIFVDVEGSFHICERVPSNIPIGSVDRGLDFEKIAEILSNYFNHLDKCSLCKAQKLCQKCYQSFATDKGFLCSSKLCEELNHSLIESLTFAFTTAELDPDIVERYDIPHEKSEKKYHGE